MSEMRTSRIRRVISAGIGLALWGCLQVAASHADAKEKGPPRISPRQLRADIDVSPLPNYTGDFVSMGLDGQWRKPVNAPHFLGAAVAGSEGPPANCSREAIIHYASQAPGSFEQNKKGLLYGVETHTPATRVWNIPGFNSCALVVYAILKKAGCDWIKYTANAKGLYDMVAAKGWRRTDTQEGGCVVAWNARWEGKRERIGRDSEGGKRGTLFRHVGVTTGGYMSVDNTSVISRPTAFLTWRPYRYERPMFLCPPLAAPEKKAR